MQRQGITRQHQGIDRPTAPRKRMAAVLLASVLTLLAVGQAITAESGGYQVVGGVGVYLGVLPSEMLKDRAKAGRETTMHGGPAGGEHEHHVLVALFDARTGERITDADVQATVREIGLGGRTKRLEAMPMAEALTYGNYFQMRTRGRRRSSMTTKDRLLPEGMIVEGAALADGNRSRCPS